MICTIMGKDNKTVKLSKALHKKSERQKNGCFIAEGKRIVDEALRFCTHRIRFLIVSERFAGQESEFMERIESSGHAAYAVSDKVFSDIADTDTPQGVLAAVNMPEEVYVPTMFDENIIVIDGVSEPGNMGTIIRTAEAFGFDGVYITKGSADLYGQKTVRATMGSVFRMKFKTDCTADEVLALKKLGFEIAATSPNSDATVEKFIRARKQALIIGNEAHGVCRELFDGADDVLKIRMDGMAESLNAAVAAGITMHMIKNCSKMRA